MTGTIGSPRTSSPLRRTSETPLSGGIVVAVDGSTESIAALDTAALIAKRRRCVGHVVSVLPQFPSYRINPGTKARMDNVDELRLRLRDTALMDVLNAVDVGEGWSREVAVGRTAPVIVSIAEERGAELIVIGCRAHGVVDRILGGETTLQVMRLSRIPVLGVPSGLEGLRRVAVAVDFSPSSEHAAQLALEMLDGSGTLYLVHVEPPVELFPHGFTIPGDILDPGDIKTCFHRLVVRLHAPEGVIVETVTLNGKPVPTVLEFAGHVGAEMVAAGSHGHTRMEPFSLAASPRASFAMPGARF